MQFYNSSSSTWKATDAIGWNEEWTDWQYMSGMVKAPSSYTKVRVYVNYEYNVNEADFDGIALYREAYGEQYNYNDKGLLRNVTTTAGNQDIRLYDTNSNMSDYSAPGATLEHCRGMHYGGFSDGDTRKKHLMRYETSPMKVQDVYAYDTYGNRTSHKRQDVSATTALYATKAYTANGNHLASETDTRGLTTTFAYNANDTASKVTLPNGEAADYSYDTHRRLTATLVATGNGNYRNAYTYTNDRLTGIGHNSTTDSCNVFYTLGYDGFGHPTTVSVGNGSASHTLLTNTYDGDRQRKLRKVTYGNGQYIHPKERSTV